MKFQIVTFDEAVAWMRDPGTKISVLQEYEKIGKLEVLYLKRAESYYEEVIAENEGRYSTFLKKIGGHLLKDLSAASTELSGGSGLKDFPWLTYDVCTVPLPTPAQAPDPNLVHSYNFYHISRAVSPLNDAWLDRWQSEEVLLCSLDKRKPASKMYIYFMYNARIQEGHFRWSIDGDSETERPYSYAPGRYSLNEVIKMVQTTPSPEGGVATYKDLGVHDLILSSLCLYCTKNQI